MYERKNLRNTSTERTAYVVSDAQPDGGPKTKRPVTGCSTIVNYYFPAQLTYERRDKRYCNSQARAAIAESRTASVRPLQSGIVPAGYTCGTRPVRI